MSDLRIIARQIKQKITVTEASSWYGYSYNQEGRNECPKCANTSSSRKTLAIYDDTSWYCFHCSEGGDVIDWLAAQQHTTKGDAIMRLASRLGITGDISELIKYLKERMSPTIKAELARESANLKRSRLVRKYFYESRKRATLLDDNQYSQLVQTYWDLEWRAINGEDTVAIAKFLVSNEIESWTGAPVKDHGKYYRFGAALAESYSKRTPEYLVGRFGQAACNVFMLGGAAASHQFNDRQLAIASRLGLLGKKSQLPLMRGRAIFPIRDITGKIIAFGGRRLSEDSGAKYLNTGDSPIFSKRRNLYGIHEAAPYILARGYAVIVEGYGATIALHRRGIRNTVGTLGTALTEEQADLLARLARIAVTVFDGDDAGYRAARRADIVLKSSRIQSGNLRISAGEDPEDRIARIGPAAMVREIRSAMPERFSDQTDRYGIGLFRRKIGFLAES